MPHAYITDSHCRFEINSRPNELMYSFENSSHSSQGSLVTFSKLWHLKDVVGVLSSYFLFPRELAVVAAFSNMSTREGGERFLISFLIELRLLGL